MTERVVRARFEGAPPMVALEADGVPDRVWYEISLVLFGDSVRSPTILQVSPESLLRNRTRFRSVLGEYDISFQASEAVVELLRRGNTDHRSFTTAIARDHRPEHVDIPHLLAGSSHTLVRELRDFQRDDLAALYSLDHGANFSVPGAGKTTVSYVLHALEKARGKVTKLLVVSPISAFGAWEEDAGAVLSPPPSVARMRDGHVPSTDVILVNYQRLPHVLEPLIAWSLRNSVHLVVDEAHRAKRGIGGEWGRALLALGPHAVRRDVLTGTPAPNHPRDVVPLLDLLWPSGRASSLIPQAALVKDPTPGSMRALNEAISPLYVRTTKSRLGLPEVNFVPIELEMKPLQQQIYDAMLNQYAGALDLSRRDSSMFAQMGEVVMYLLQAASSPRLLRSSADPARSYRFPPLAIPPGSKLAAMVETYADHEIPSKIDAACRIVFENSRAGRKTLVWSNFPDNLLDLEQQLARLEPAVIYGAVSSAEDAEPGVRTRERELRRFRDDDSCRVLLANPAALAEGVSLHHSCHDAIYVDRTFNAGQYLQSLDRIHRLGLAADTVTTFTLLTSRGTIDERVHRRVYDKTTRLSQMLADEHLVQMALPDEEDGLGFLPESDLDLEAILTHLAEASDQNEED